MKNNTLLLFLLISITYACSKKNDQVPQPDTKQKNIYMSMQVFYEGDYLKYDKTLVSNALEGHINRANYVDLIHENTGKKENHLVLSDNELELSQSSYIKSTKPIFFLSYTGSIQPKTTEFEEIGPMKMTIHIIQDDKIIESKSREFNASSQLQFFDYQYTVK